MSLKEPSWVTYIHQRIAKNKNFLGAIVGKTGSGKTFSALSIAEQLDPEFNIERVCFKAIELMRLINSGKLKSGSAIVFDEAGIDLNNRNWQSAMNKVINYLLQTFRHRNFILIFTTPDLGFIDSSTKRLFHALFQTTQISLRNKTCGIKPKLLDYNPNNNKIYTPYLRVLKNGRYTKIKLWNVKIPSEKLINEYEKKKTAFTTKLNKEIEQTLLGIELEGSIAEKKIKRLELTEHQKEIAELLKEHTVKEITKIKGIGETSVRDTMRFIKKKGWNITAIRDENNRALKYRVIPPENL